MAAACLPGKTGSTSAKDSSSFLGYTQGFPTPDPRFETWGTELSLKLKPGFISPVLPAVVSRTGTQLSSQPSARAELHSANPQELVGGPRAPPASAPPLPPPRCCMCRSSEARRGDGTHSASFRALLYQGSN